MVLVSLLLVLAAAVALVIGLLQSGLAIIYVSIGCSVVAGVLLAVAVVRGKPERVSSGPMPRPAPPGAPPPPEPSAASPSWQSPQPDTEPEREREPVMAGASGGASGSSGETQQLDQAAIELAVRGDDDDGPIPDYDRLRATEVLPLLAGLDAAQLAQVRAQEVGGRNRFMVLSRIDRELEARGPADAEDEPETSDGEWDRGDDWAGSEAVAESDDEVGVGAPDDEDDEEDEEEPAAVFAAPAGSKSILDNYEQLKVLEILPRLGELNADELAQVRRREQAGQRRAMIINRVDRLIVDARPTPTARPASAVGSATPPPARRGRATKTTAKKAPAAAPAVKTAARKATARKAAATRAPAKKAAAAKAPAKAAVAKKVAAKKASAKKAPAKKVVARTSTPVEKRAASVRKTTKATKKR